MLRVIEHVLMECKLIVVIERVAALLFPLEIPSVRLDRRVSWEAAIHIILPTIIIIMVIVSLVLEVGVNGEGRLSIVLLVMLILGVHHAVMMVISHAWLVIKHVSFFFISQVHHRVVGKVLALLNELSERAIMVSLLSHWMSG